MAKYEEPYQSSSFITAMKDLFKFCKKIIRGAINPCMQVQPSFTKILKAIVTPNGCATLKLIIRLLLFTHSYIRGRERNVS